MGQGWQLRIRRLPRCGGYSAPLRWDSGTRRFYDGSDCPGSFPLLVSDGSDCPGSFPEERRSERESGRLELPIIAPNWPPKPWLIRRRLGELTEANSSEGSLPSPSRLMQGYSPTGVTCTQNAAPENSLGSMSARPGQKGGRQSLSLWLPKRVSEAAVLRKSWDQAMRRNWPCSKASSLSQRRPPLRASNSKTLLSGWKRATKSRCWRSMALGSETAESRSLRVLVMAQLSRTSPRSRSAIRYRKCTSPCPSRLTSLMSPARFLRMRALRCSSTHSSFFRLRSASFPVSWFCRRRSSTRARCTFSYTSMRWACSLRNIWQRNSQTPVPGVRVSRIFSWSISRQVSEYSRLCDGVIAFRPAMFRASAFSASLYKSPLICRRSPGRPSPSYFTINSVSFSCLCSSASIGRCFTLVPPCLWPCPASGCFGTVGF